MLDDILAFYKMNGIRETLASYSTDTASTTLELLFGEEHLRNLRRSATVDQPDAAPVAKG
jgi:hypothetical protein